MVGFFLNKEKNELKGRRLSSLIEMVFGLKSDGYMGALDSRKSHLGDTLGGGYFSDWQRVKNWQNFTDTWTTVTEKFLKLLFLCS